MSAETFDFHHGKHHKAYVDKTNGMLAEKGLEGASLTEVIKASVTYQGVTTSAGPVKLKPSKGRPGAGPPPLKVSALRSRLR